LRIHAEREGGRQRALTDEGPDEADDVLREVEEREVLEPPRLRPEPLRRPRPPNVQESVTVSDVWHSTGRGEARRERLGVLTESPEGRPG
jgi:hypothetical protein